MKRMITYISACLTVLMVATVYSVAAHASQPVANISKQVQNVTQGTSLKDANDSYDAITANTGDILKFVVTVKNVGKYDRNGNNDLYNTKVNDTLPDGISPDSGTLNRSLGQIKPGSYKRYDFTVKVTSSDDSEVLCSVSDLTGSNKTNDQTLKHSDKACVKVMVSDPKKIRVCYKDKGPQLHLIKETAFDKETMSKNYKDCKKPESIDPEDKNIEICMLKDKEIKIIKESKYDKRTMSRNKNECNTFEYTQASEPSRQRVKLSETGVMDFLGGLVGVGSIAAVSYIYFRSRNN